MWSECPAQETHQRIRATCPSSACPELAQAVGDHEVSLASSGVVSRLTAVSCGCCDSTTSQGLSQQKVFLTALSSKARVPADSVPGQDSLPGWWPSSGSVLTQPRESMWAHCGLSSSSCKDTTLGDPRWRPGEAESLSLRDWGPGGGDSVSLQDSPPPTDPLLCTPTSQSRSPAVCQHRSLADCCLLSTACPPLACCPKSTGRSPAGNC